MTAAAARLRAVQWEAALDRRFAAPAAVCALTLLSLVVRTRQLHAGFWIDEGISVGIAHHHWTSIPHVLRQDGSPPAYYLLLGLWIRLFGDGETATHTLSLVFALGCVPLAYAAGRSVFDRRTGLICAALAAFDPYLTYYAQETRMYSLAAFLSLVVALAYVNGILRARRLWAVALVPALDLLVYTHNWGLFVCVGLAAATALVARERLRLFALVAAAVALLYLPWVPELLYQVRHTAAPWSKAPGFYELVLAPSAVLTGDGPLVAFALAGGAGLAAVVRGRGSAERQVVLALAVAAGVAIAVAWLESQISPAWATRYFAVVLGPLLLLAGRGVRLGRRLGVAALVVVAVYWLGYSVHDDKENARALAAAVAPYVHRGELVVSTHPEQVPVLRYYLGPGPRFATTLGPVADAQVFDWRSAVERLRAAQPRATLDRLLATVPPGGELVVVTPVFRVYHAWDSTWTKLVWQRSTAWSALLAADPRLRLQAHLQTNELAVREDYWKLLQAFVYRRTR